MLKFLRKYNKWILVIGGGFLMVSFLLPQAIQQCAADPSKSAAAFVSGRKVILRDYSRAASELALIERFLGTPVAFVTDDEPKQAAHWLMLKHEARAGGFLSEGIDDLAILEARQRQIAQSLMDGYQRAKQQHDFADLIGGMTPELRNAIREVPGLESDAAFAKLALDPQAFMLWASETANTLAPALVENQIFALATSLKVRPDDIHAALSSFAGVERMFNSYLTAARFSDRQAIAAARRQQDAVMADFVLLRGGLGRLTYPEVTDAEIEAHVEAFKDLEPGSGEQGFGYRRPARVKVEYLKIDRAAIEALIVVDPVEANVRYRRDRALYTGTFAQERARIESELKQERVAQVLDRIQQIIRTEVLAQTARLAPDGKFKRLPPDWASMRPRMEAIAHAVQAQILQAEGLTLPFPTVRVMNARWLTAEDLAGLEGIGSATLGLANRTISFPELVMQTRELEGAGPTPLQVGIPSVEQPLMDFARNRYYFTVLDSRLPSPPESVDEVREMARLDLQRLKVYQSLMPRVEEIRSMAIAQGLSGVAHAFSEPWVSGFPPLTPPPSPENQPSVSLGATIWREGASEPALNIDELRHHFFETARAYPTPEALGAAPRESRIIVVASPKELGVVVAEMTAVRPLTIDAYRQNEARIIQNAVFTELRGEAPDLRAALEPFSYDTMARRLSLRIVGEKEEPVEGS